MDTLLIRNSLTGHIWKFPCAQWIGLGAEDSSGTVSKFISFFESLFWSGSKIVVTNISSLVILFLLLVRLRLQDEA